MRYKSPIFTIAVAETLTIITLILGLESYPFLASINPIFAAIIPAITVIAIFFLFLTILKKNFNPDDSLSTAIKLKASATILAQIQLITFFLFYSSKMFIIFGKIATISAFFFTVAVLNSNLLLSRKTPSLNNNSEIKKNEEIRIMPQNNSVSTKSEKNSENLYAVFTEEEVKHISQRLKAIRSTLSPENYYDGINNTSNQKYDLIPLVQAMIIATYTVAFLGNILLKIIGKSNSIKTNSNLKSSTKEVNLNFTSISSTSLASYKHIIPKNSSHVFYSDRDQKNLDRNSGKINSKTHNLPKHISANFDATYLSALGFSQFTIISFAAITAIRKRANPTYRF